MAPASQAPRSILTRPVIRPATGTMTLPASAQRVVQGVALAQLAPLFKDVRKG